MAFQQPEPTPDISQLKAILLTSGLQDKNQPLYQVIDNLIDYLVKWQSQVNAKIGSGNSPSGIMGESFLTADSELGLLPNSKQVIAGPGIQFNDAPAGRRVISATPSFPIEPEQGNEGFTGMQGIPGIKGDIGPRGLDGFDGERGEEGFPGMQGPIGPTGATGSAGAPGISGMNGIDGLDGEDGFDGMTGSVGPPGPTGATGSIGPAGLNGFDGEDGVEGFPGFPGLPGSPGIAGRDGFSPIVFDGEQGEEGFQGFPGPKGDKGDTGASGIITVDFDPEEIVERPTLIAIPTQVYGGSLAEPRTIDISKTILANTSEVIIGPVTVNAGKTITFQDAQSRLQIIGGAPTPFATSYKLTSSPTSIIGAERMQGYAASITPTRSGRVLILMTGQITTQSIGVLIDATMRLRYGTGSAPTNGASPVGAVVVKLVVQDSVAAVPLNLPFALSGIVTGLTIGTAYWVDISIALGSINGTDQVSISIEEF